MLVFLLFLESEARGDGGQGRRGEDHYLLLLCGAMWAGGRNTTSPTAVMEVESRRAMSGIEAHNDARQGVAVGGGTAIPGDGGRSLTYNNQKERHRQEKA